MLSDLFQNEEIRRASRSAAVQQQRDARDAFIQAQFPLGDAAFSSLVDATVGLDSHLTVTHTTVTDHFTNHTVGTLDKTITVVQSTLYGAPEQLTFTPLLEAIAPDQFGVVKISSDGLPDSVIADPGAEVFSAMLSRGILMRGKTTFALVVPDGGNFTSLTTDLLEGFLAALFIRTR